MTPSDQLRLLAWYDANKRDLPWRRSRDPYAIWVSEIMLQQTQVATVIPYWERWMARWPTVQALSLAPEGEVLAAWAGLGYYRRCRSLLAGARQLAALGTPGSAADWLKVPGVGPYTAAAIASIALGEAVPLVDGNVERVFARFTACELTGSALHKSAAAWAADVLVGDRAGDWNQALMELGATVCTPRAPECRACPLRSSCRALSAGRATDLPRPEPKRAVVPVRHVVWVPVYEGRLGLRRIPVGEWWEGLWEFPRVAVDPESPGGLLENGEVESLRGWLGSGELVRLGAFRHAVTHHRISVEAFLLHAEARVEGLSWVEVEAVRALALPAPVKRVFTWTFGVLER